MPVGSKLRRLLQGQRQKISHHHSRLGLQMDPHPLPVLAESNSLQRRQIPGDPQEKRFHFCHPPSPKIILRIIMKSIDGGAQGTRSGQEAKRTSKSTPHCLCIRTCCEPRTARGPAPVSSCPQSFRVSFRFRFSTFGFSSITFAHAKMGKNDSRAPPHAPVRRRC